MYREYCVDILYFYIVNKDIDRNWR